MLENINFAGARQARRCERSPQKRRILPVEWTVQFEAARFGHSLVGRKQRNHGRILQRTALDQDKNIITGVLRKHRGKAALVYRDTGCKCGPHAGQPANHLEFGDKNVTLVQYRLQCFLDDRTGMGSGYFLLLLKL